MEDLLSEVYHKLCFIGISNMNLIGFRIISSGNLLDIKNKLDIVAKCTKTHE